MKNHSTNKALKRGKTLIIALALVCFALRSAPNAFGVVPAPDGGYPGFNTAQGEKALFGLTTGVGNTAVGWYSLFSNTDGSFNTGVGAGTLLFNVGDQTTGAGVNNTALGGAALLFNTTGHENTAVGTQALFSNTIGLKNVATGYQALASNTTGFSNTAVGTAALLNNTIGHENTAIGDQALNLNSTGDGNTANGYLTLVVNTTGGYNTANGWGALANNTTGGDNTATGVGALLGNTEGFSNTAIGSAALNHNTTGDSNIALGVLAGSNVNTASNVIAIGHAGANVSNSCYIGNIFGTLSTGTAVFINQFGQLGTATSSRRFKKEIKPMDGASEAILALQPVTFHYKSDSTGTPQFGLIAEEVAEVNPDLVVRDENGEIYTVRYDAVNAMLLNEFLKEHRKVEEQQATITELKRDFQLVSARQQKEIQILSAQLKEQAAQIQKVSAQMEVSKPTPRMAVRNP